MPRPSPVLLSEEGERRVSDVLDALSGHDLVPDGRTTTRKIHDLRTYIRDLEIKSSDSDYLLTEANDALVQMTRERNRYLDLWQKLKGPDLPVAEQFKDRGKL